MQQRYNGIKDFQGDFVQTYEGGVLRTKTTERGTVAIKRPGRMRFIYTKPERKEFVSDGTRLYTHLVADKQVIVSPAPAPTTATSRRCSSPARSTSPATTRRRFTPLPGAAAGLLTLKLVPKNKQSGLRIAWHRRRPENAADPVPDRGRQARAAVRRSPSANLKENRGLSDKDFEFRIPRGVDVVTNGARAQ